jgi:hypothetical protein
LLSVCCECCVLSARGFCNKLNHSSREFLLTVVCYCMWSRNFLNEEALAHWGLSHQNVHIYLSSWNWIISDWLVKHVPAQKTITFNLMNHK